MTKVEQFLRSVSVEELRKKAREMSQAELADYYGVSRRTIGLALRRNQILSRGKIPESVERLPPSSDLALLIGAVLGDGCITQNPRCQCLDIACFDGQTEWIAELTHLIQRLFGKPPSTRPGTGKCTHLRIYKKGICVMLGLPAGDKIRNRVGIPSWIYSRDAYVAQCLRGLFETDGCFALNSAKKVYMVEFKNRNDRLLEDCERALKVLGFHPQRGELYVRLARKEEIRRFTDLTGFLKTDYSKMPKEDQRLIRRGREVECALTGCTNMIYYTPAFETRTGKHYCSPQHAAIARRKVERPSKETLKEAIHQGIPWTELGRRYGVSDNAVRKWAKAYGLSLKR